MKVDYESQADTLQIGLAENDHADRSDTSIPLTVVAIAGDEPVGIDLRDVADHGTDAPLRAVAQKYDLDENELIAAGRAALEMPDRTITLDFA